MTPLLGWQPERNRGRRDTESDSEWEDCCRVLVTSSMPSAVGEGLVKDCHLSVIPILTQRPQSIILVLSCRALKIQESHGVMEPSLAD